MNIDFKNDFEKEFIALRGGTAFVSDGHAYIKMNGTLKSQTNGIYFNAISLYTGSPAQFDDDERVQTLQFEGEWYIG